MEDLINNVGFVDLSAYSEELVTESFSLLAAALTDVAAVGSPSQRPNGCRLKINSHNTTLGSKLCAIQKATSLE